MAKRTAKSTSNKTVAGGTIRICLVPRDPDDQIEYLRELREFLADVAITMPNATVDASLISQDSVDEQVESKATAALTEVLEQEALRARPQLVPEPMAAQEHGVAFVLDVTDTGPRRTVENRRDGPFRNWLKIHSGRGWKIVCDGASLAANLAKCFDEFWRPPT